MQQNKNTKFKGELTTIINEESGIESKLESVMSLFAIKKQLSAFDSLKNRGHNLSDLLCCLILMSLQGVSNVFKLTIQKQGVNKDAYYSAKNNEYINWHQLLILTAHHFRWLISNRPSLQKEGITALIADDSPLKKTGKKMEKVSMIHDHVTNTYILGFKLLVLGFWDGGSFIPVSFSLHREKGSKLKKATDAHKQSVRAEQKANVNLTNAQQALERKQTAVNKHKAITENTPTRTNLNRLINAANAEEKAMQKVASYEKLLQEKKTQQEKLKQERDKIAKTNPTYGLNRKEKAKQFKKKRAAGSCGSKRDKEADISKIDMLVTMLKQAVKKGFVPDYVLTDTWFFCKELLLTVNDMATKGVKLLSMAKMGNATYTLVSDGKKYNIHTLLKMRNRQAKYSRKLKAHYIKIPVVYADIRVDLFLVKFGGNGTWRLLVTNDLSMTFTKVMEVYKLRWSIEVFFKECKQYLHLGGSHSSDFDAQIADTTLSMIQHIMLVFFKRMNHQQSFGEIFKDVSDELIEATLAETIWEIFIKVMVVLAEIINADAMEMQIQAMRKPEAMHMVKRLICERRELKSVA